MRAFRRHLHTLAIPVLLVASAWQSAFAEDAESRIPLSLLPSSTEDISPNESEKRLGLIGPVEVDEFAIGTTNAAFFARVHDATSNTLSVTLSLTNYDANRIFYDFFFSPSSNLATGSVRYSCPAADGRFKAFSVVCLNWIDRNFPAEDRQRLFSGDLSTQASNASEALSIFDEPGTDLKTLSDVMTTNQAAAVFGLSCPVAVTTFACCACGHILFFSLEDAKGKEMGRVVGHADDPSTLSSPAAAGERAERGPLSPAQFKALRVLCLDWIGRTFPKTEDGLSFVLRSKSEITANRIFAYFDHNRRNPLCGLTYVDDDGKPFTGKVCKRYSSGKIERVTPSLNGRKNGVARSWHENGLKAEECVLVEGWCLGEQTSWYSNGVKKSVIKTQGGLVGNTMSWWPNGKQKREIYVDPKNGGLTRVVKHYMNGLKQIDCVWTNDAGGGCYWYIIGQWNENGRPQAVTNNINCDDNFTTDD